MKNVIIIPSKLQQATTRCLQEKLHLARQHFAYHFLEPAISYQQRGTIAGSAWPHLWEIRLNAILLLENQQDFIAQVVPHELAHLLVFHRFGRVSPHGKEWRWIMENVLHTKASRTHHFVTTSVKKTFPYQCRCRQHPLTLRRHNRVQRGICQYLCQYCGEKLILT